MISSAPSQNVTLPLSQTDPAVFTCTAQGTFVFWKINGTKVLNVLEFEKKNRDIDINQSVNSNGSLTINIAIDISIARNETRISCVVQHREPNPTEMSQEITLIVAGTCICLPALHA